MENLFNSNDVAKALSRIDQLKPDTQRLWGTMNAAQMLAHCNIAIETAIGKHNMKRAFISRLIAPFFRAGVLNEKPFGMGSPTHESYIFPSDVSFEESKTKLKASLTAFCEGGPSKCTSHQHLFFGHFTPEEWARFQWKHLDHHLRQFGV